MKKTIKSLIKDELIQTLNESMIRVNGGRMGAVETMKDKPPFANEEEWMIKHGLTELLEQESPMENDIIDDLRSALQNWETKEYTSHESRWNEYYKDIEAIVNKYTG